MKLHYYLHNSKAKTETSVWGLVSYQGRQYKLQTGIKTDPAWWNKKSQCAASGFQYTGGELVNMRLNEHRRRVEALFREYLIRKEIPSRQEVRGALADAFTATQAGEQPLFIDYFVQHYQHAGYKPETLKKYKTAEGWLRRYEKTFRQRLTFSDIGMKFYTRFRDWVLSGSYEQGGQRRYYSLNYLGSLVKCIKVVMREHGPGGITPLHNNTEYNNSRFKVESEAADTIYLSVPELMKIHHYTATPDNINPVCTDARTENRGRKAEAINAAKNRFLIGCFTALRVSDFNRLDEVNIQESYIRIKPQKGTRKNDDVVIPIHPVVHEILASGYDLHARISEQKINRHIKEVCRLVGITAPVSVSRTEGGRLVTRTLPKSDLVGTHTARRSGATNMYLAGVPSISIMKITGHKTERSFMKYIRITAEENAALLSKHPFFNNIF